MFKKHIIILFFLLLNNLTANAMPSPLGQTLQVNTHFSSILGKPSWTLIVRDEQTGRVLPYLFDIRNNDNFWIAFTAGHSYRVTASFLKFGPYATIPNFCQLEDGVIEGKSMWITLTGTLTPNAASSTCHVMRYHDMPFPIVSQ